MVCASSLAFASSSSDKEKINLMQRQLTRLQSQIDGMKKQSKKTEQEEVAQVKRYIQKSHMFKSLGNTVVTAPYTGRPTFNTGGQLLVNAPSINEEVKLL